MRKDFLRHAIGYPIKIGVMGENHAKIWGKWVPSRGNFTCKGPEVEISLETQRITRKPVFQEKSELRKRMVADEIQGRGQTLLDLLDMISSLNLFQL